MCANDVRRAVRLSLVTAPLLLLLLLPRVTETQLKMPWLLYLADGNVKNCLLASIPFFLLLLLLLDRPTSLSLSLLPCL